ncbi:MAG: molybdenum hydroxylase accessory protein YgfJ family [Herbinix sp.]|jgi:molybdenum cofactor cytidylyltransferase|nr:molybdenum hydroxylase accessory protein YgfJ family [Herbinix sp.]
MIAVILAAGLSKRFGGKKLLAQVDGREMVLHVAELVERMDFEQRIFVYSDAEVLKRVKDNCVGAVSYQYLNNDQAEKGLSTSIRLAMENLSVSESDTGIIFFVADQPFVDEATVYRLKEAYEQRKGSIIVPLYGENRGNPVIFSRKWTQNLKNLEGDVGGRSIIRENSGEVWEVSITDDRIGRDIDTKEEYRALFR